MTDGGEQSLSADELELVALRNRARDAVSAIRPATWQRIVTLARAARDASNSDVVRALLDELEAVGR
jgi:hypothetical protein